MIFSTTHWIRSNAHKMDKPLCRELLQCYKHSKAVPCFLHSLFNKLRYWFKKVNVIVREADAIYPGEQDQIRAMLKSKRSAAKKIKKMNCYPARLTLRQINKLLEMNSIKSIHLDREVRALLNHASPSIKAPAAWSKGRTGKGITIAVVDTGVHPHEDLTSPVNRIIAFKDFIKNRTAPYDDNGHGTHVAGDAAANGASSDGLYKAPAYESNIAGVKVLNKLGAGTLSRIISGIEWCIENKDRYNIRVMCLSLGSQAVSSYKDDLLCEAVENAWDSGIVVCAAAGNEGPGSETIASPGIDPKIITVGAINDLGTDERFDDEIADFSSRGPTIDGLVKPDLLSPGVDIVSLRSPGSYIDKRMGSARIGSSYISLSGTSMATPLCCGCAALLLEENPELTPREVKEILMNSAQDMGYDENTQGQGCIDMEKSLDTSRDI